MSEKKTFIPKRTILLVLNDHKYKLISGMAYTIQKDNGQVDGVSLSSKTITAAVHTLALAQQDAELMLPSTDPAKTEEVK